MKRFLIALGICIISSASFASEHFTNIEAGYLDGFYLQTADGRYRLKMGARLNFGYGYGIVPDGRDLNSFDITHGKLYFGGNVFSPDVAFYLQFAGGQHDRTLLQGPIPEVQNTGLNVEDYFVRLSRGDVVIKLGQFKVPFVRQWMTYSGNLAFVERSLASRAFSFGRDRGVTVEKKTASLSVTAGIFNGGGEPANGQGFLPATFATSGQNASNDFDGGSRLLYVTRVSLTPMGTLSFEEDDIRQSEAHVFGLGLGFVFDHGRDIDINSIGLADDTRANTYNGAIDMTWKKGGASLQAEGMYRYLKSDLVADTHALGFYVQPAFMVVPGSFGISTRFGYFDSDTRLDDNSLLEISAAGNYYISGDHRYKVTTQYGFKKAQSPFASSLKLHQIDCFLQLTL